MSRQALTFHDALTDAYSGQTNHVMTALLDKEPVGTLQYTVFRDEPSISMIDVPEQHRRRGIGMSLVKELQRQFPDTEIEWGMLTPEGAALKQSLPVIQVPTEYAAKFDDLAATRAALARLSERSSAGTITAEEIAGWNDLHDRESELEYTLAGKSPTKNLIDTREAPAPSHHEPDATAVCPARLANLDRQLDQSPAVTPGPSM